MTATTLKVSAQTRDRVKSMSALEHRTADQIVSAGLDALEMAQLRRQARVDAARLADDPADREEMERVLRDMQDLRAW